MKAALRCPGCGVTVPIEGARCARCWTERRRWRCRTCNKSRIASTPLVALVELWEHDLTEHRRPQLRAVS